MIVFTSARDDPSQTGNWELYTMNADGTGQTRITNNTTLDNDPDWQPVNPAEPPSPASRDDCKKNSWRNYAAFKNQGQCVSIVASRGQNGPGKNLEN